MLIIHERGALQLCVINYFIKEIIGRAETDRNMEVFMTINASHTGLVSRDELFAAYKRFKYNEV